jgi:predicted ATPase
VEVLWNELGIEPSFETLKLHEDILAGTLQTPESDSNKHALLFLDNFEYVLEAAPLVSSLLSAAPRLQVLATSRESLHFTGEHEYHVPSLTVPDLTHIKSLADLSVYESVALFIQRARAVSPNFSLTEENAADIAGICLQLDGLPLAIELAAARIRLFSPQQLLERLESRPGTPWIGATICWTRAKNASSFGWRFSPAAGR